MLAAIDSGLHRNLYTRAIQENGIVVDTDLPAAAHKLRLQNVSVDNERGMEQIAELHMELLDFGPMAGLGKEFVKEICYRNHMRSDVLWVSIAEIDGHLAGFVAITPFSATFHRSGLRQNFASTLRHTIMAVLRAPRRLVPLLRALRVLASRRRELESVDETVGEVVCVAVRPEFLSKAVSNGIGIRLSQRLIEHGAACLSRCGAKSTRMLVDADNRAALMLYHLMGADFAERELGGEPIMQVSFDLDKPEAGDGKALPSTWLAPSDSQSESSGWQAYWNTVSSKPQIFAADARDYIDRLCRNVNIRKSDVVLDFGCGFADSASRLIDKVTHIDIWDNAANVRAQALRRTACVANIGYASFLDSEDPERRYDHILVHSVVQYMTEEELGDWLQKWRKMLKADGCLVISDVLQKPGNFRAEVMRLLKFSVANGFFINATLNGIRQSRNYLATRDLTDLTVITPDVLESMAKRAGYRIRILAENLSYRAERYAAVLTPNEQAKQ